MTARKSPNLDRIVKEIGLPAAASAFGVSGSVSRAGTRSARRNTTKPSASRTSSRCWVP